MQRTPPQALHSCVFIRHAQAVWGGQREHVRARLVAACASLLEIVPGCLDAAVLSRPGAPCLSAPPCCCTALGQLLARARGPGLQRMGKRGGRLPTASRAPCARVLRLQLTLGGCPVPSSLNLLPLTAWRCCRREGRAAASRPTVSARGTGGRARRGVAGGGLRQGGGQACGQGDPQSSSARAHRWVNLWSYMLTAAA